MRTVLFPVLQRAAKPSDGLAHFLLWFFAYLPGSQGGTAHVIRIPGGPSHGFQRVIQNSIQNSTREKNRTRHLTIGPTLDPKEQELI
jgi:hypothetical protein